MRNYEVWHFFTYKKITSKKTAFEELKLYDSTKTIDDITVKYLHRVTERYFKKHGNQHEYIVTCDKNIPMKFTDKKGLFGIPVWYCKRIVYEQGASFVVSNSNTEAQRA